MVAKDYFPISDVSKWFTLYSYKSYTPVLIIKLISFTLLDLNNSSPIHLVDFGTGLFAKTPSEDSGGSGGPHSAGSGGPPLTGDSALSSSSFFSTNIISSMGASVGAVGAQVGAMGAQVGAQVGALSSSVGSTVGAVGAQVGALGSTVGSTVSAVG